MQAWWAEENSLKTLKILLFKNFWLVDHILIGAMIYGTHTVQLQYYTYNMTHIILFTYN